jgi:transposase-like protein
MPKTLVKVGDFCPNTSCDDHGKLQNASQHNIIKFGQTSQGHQRYRCKTCKRTFVETKGTLFYRRRTPADKIIKVLALLAEGTRISSLARTQGHKEDTILEWLQEAAAHAEAVEAVLLADYQLTRGQIDDLWAYVGTKGGKKLSRNGRNGAVLALDDGR